MRRLAALLGLLGLAALGCTSTTIETPTLKLRRLSFLQRVEIPKLTMATNGAVTLQGYKTDGGSDAAAAIVSAAVSAALKAP